MKQWANSIITYCKNVTFFYKLIFLIFFHFKNVHSPHFYDLPLFWHLSEFRWHFCIPPFTVHFGEILSLHLRKGREIETMLSRICDEIFCETNSIKDNWQGTKCFWQSFSFSDFLLNPLTFMFSYTRFFLPSNIKRKLW